MKLSDGIEQFIIKLLEDNGEVEIGRNDLAQYFGCVPSQINYVISTRFTTERGYIVESRRGGGGFVRITKISVPESEYVMHVINSIGNEIDYQSVNAICANMYETGRMTEREAKLILAATSAKALPFRRPVCDTLRANIFKNMLANLI